MVKSVHLFEALEPLGLGVMQRENGFVFCTEVAKTGDVNKGNWTLIQSAWSVAPYSLSRSTFGYIPISWNDVVIVERLEDLPE